MNGVGVEKSKPWRGKRGYVERERRGWVKEADERRVRELERKKDERRGSDTTGKMKNGTWKINAWQKEYTTGNRSHVNCGVLCAGSARAYGPRGRALFIFPGPARKNGRINDHYLVAAAGKLRGTSGHFSSPLLPSSTPPPSLFRFASSEAVLIIRYRSNASEQKFFRLNFKFSSSLSFFFSFFDRSLLLVYVQSRLITSPETKLPESKYIHGRVITEICK